jgi:hypothetical protein
MSLKDHWGREKAAFHQILAHISYKTKMKREQGRTAGELVDCLHLSTEAVLC